MNKEHFGIDVSKNKLDLCWLRDRESRKLKSKVFSNSPEGIEELCVWVSRHTGESAHNCVFVLESTGVYHELVAYTLHGLGAQVRMTQPQQFHHFIASFGVRSKTDKRDSSLLAQYGADGNGRAWQPEPVEIRHLKKLLGRLEALDQDIQREQNRLEAAEIGKYSEVVVESIQRILAALGAEKARLEKDINDHIDGHPNLKKDASLLKSIPGIGQVLSSYLLSVLRSREFNSAREGAAYLGLTPVEKQSGSSVRGRPRLSKAGNATVRAKLYMAAVVAIQHNPDAKALYQRLLNRGKAKMSALGAVMRKLVHISFGVLKHSKEYCPQTN